TIQETSTRRKKTKKNDNDEYNDSNCDEDSDDAGTIFLKKIKSRDTIQMCVSFDHFFQPVAVSDVVEESDYEDKKSRSKNISKKTANKALGNLNSIQNKLKAYFKAKNEERYSWLQEVKDADGNLEELYERDADIGHKEFDLKLTDREEKIIRRELTSVLTAGTIVEGGLLTNEMATYCMSIKESCPAENAPPTFGICFVDTATAEFHLASFVDDVDRTQFETLIMQVKPKEIVFEKVNCIGALNKFFFLALKTNVCINTNKQGMLSQLSKRILKDCTNRPIWTALKPESEFWDANTTRSQLRMSRYFSSNQNASIAQNDVDNDGDITMFNNDEGNKIETWPSAVQEALKDPLMLSALGVFIFGNLTGKRAFKQWLCHPLRDVAAIDARLDAIDELNTVPDFQDMFTENFSHFPDLERLISRIHAGTCKVKDFLHVLVTFEKLTAYKEGNMPFYATYIIIYIIANTFTSYLLGNLLPFPGIESDYDEIIDRMTEINKKLDDHLEDAKKVNRYWNPTLQKLVRDFQEVKETQSSILKSIQGRFYQKFDAHYRNWLLAVKIVGEVDCLLSLAKSSVALG
ncbi:12687_t:CDS:2, partial [Racocetra fulgida]